MNEIRTFKEHIEIMKSEELDPALKVLYEAGFVGLRTLGEEMVTKEKAYKYLIICLGSNLQQMISENQPPTEYEASPAHQNSGS